MAEINNFTEIAENFDTIKTLLNSIRAQGILNTSDVDKLLTGINSKLEKINTEEDIDLIKIFLSELKQNLDERHNVLISKFGAIESLFSNLLKNSSDALKSGEAKELFDIVATNLSVFSREVVSQKETLTDITLRLDAMRSDDSQKKDIIKNISILKTDLEHLNNGFDSIVLSLNENFKTLIKTITGIDQSEAITKFGDELNDIVNTSNTILSALQMFDKKNLQIEEALKTLATSEDVNGAKQWLSDLVTKNHELSDSIDNLADKYYKIDSLSEKIDASVSIIAGLKTIIADKDDEHTKVILTELTKLENSVSAITTNQSFEEFKDSLETILKDLTAGSQNLQSAFSETSIEIQKLNSDLKALNIAVNFQDIKADLNKNEQSIKSLVSSATDKITQLAEVNVSKTLNNISASADILSTKLQEAHNTVAEICEKNFNEVISDISNLKTIVAQIDENNTSANNAIFSNITDRLALFENSLKNSLEKQEDYVANSSSQLVEQITNIKNLSGVLDYKIDSSVIEIGNAKREFSELKSSIQDILALDFVNAVKDLKVDLYASKQDLANAVENSSSDLAEKLTEDLFGKYELLISKLDSVEDELQQKQAEALNGFKPVLENISSSLVDILSYVSENRDFNINDINIKLADITEFVKDNNINYLENVRDVVEVIRKQVENNLNTIQKDTSKKIDTIKDAVSQNTENLREEIKYSYNKLLEIQDKFEALKDSLNSDKIVLSSNLNDIVTSTEDVKNNFELKLTTLQNALLERISEFKQEFTCENADKISEIRFSSENLFAKTLQNSTELKEELRGEIAQIIGTLKLNVQELTEQLSGFSLKTENSNENIERKVDSAIGNTVKLDESVNKISSTLLSSLNDNFKELKTLLNNFNQKSEIDFKQNRDKITEDFNSIRRAIENTGSDINQDITKQLEVMESRFSTLYNTVTNALECGNDKFNEKIDTTFADISESLAAQIKELQTASDKINNSITELSTSAKSSLTGVLAQILDNFVALKSLINSLNEKTADDIQNSVEELTNRFSELKDKLECVDKNIDEDLTRQLSIIEHGFETLTNSITDLFTQSDTQLNSRLGAGLADISDKMQTEVASMLEQYKIKLEELFDSVSENNQQQAELIKERILSLNKIFNVSLAAQNNTAAKQLEAITLQLKDILDENLKISAADYDTLKAKLENFASYLESSNNSLVDNVKKQFEEYSALSQAQLTESTDKIKDANERFISDIRAQLDDMTKFVDSGLDIQAQEVNVKFDEISTRIQQISGNLTALNNQTGNKLDSLNETLSNLKQNISGTVNDSSVLIINRLDEILKDLCTKNEEIASSVILASADIKGDIKTSVSSDMHDFTTLVETKLSELDELIENTAICQQTNILTPIKNLLEELQNANKSVKDQLDLLKQNLADNFSGEVKALTDKIQTMFEEHSLNFVSELGNTNTKFAEDLSACTLEFKAAFEALNERLDKDEISQMNVFQSQLKELSNTFNILINEAKNVTKSEVSAISETLISNSKALMDDVEQSIENKVNSMLAATADISAGELQSMEAFANKILAQADVNKQNITACKDILTKLIKNECDILAGNIEKETDVIVKDIIEQFNLMRSSQKDELSDIAVHIESSVEDYIYNYVNELKSYLDIKTDSTILNGKLDNLKNELNDTAENILDNMNKFLEAGVFSSAISDLRTANEILVSSMADKLNKQIQEFVRENVTDKFEEHLNLFDKKFIDTLVDKYEEIKLIASKYDRGFETIQISVRDLLSQFTETKDSILNKLSVSADNISNSIESLNVSFSDLKEQILNKSFDEAFQASLNNRINGIENLVHEQLGYLEDISELCCTNLPELTEMNTLVKYGVQQSVAELVSKLDSKDENIAKDLEQLKTDIITQFLNIFNQISFVAEQEEIIDFIQEKHADLITILSHIVTTSDSVSSVDSKVNTIKEDIKNINEKINSIISSEGDINYVYSLQDLESDIANLRLVLSEIKEDNKSKELEELMNSTNNIYKLVETIKTEMPKFELEEFKRDFNTLSEDIVSISTRTNKLILASDESYKTLQDNLQDFKLVINDLDERTRNFAQEAGIDRIDNKLGSINAMIQNGAKTNQVFNQVFEYLAEWVDKAGEQISTISDKVETLDDIGQIKVMLEDLKAEAEDNSESTELIEALGNVFDKQTKRISSLEAKLDRVIVETTINNKNNKIDMSPFETTLNRFLVAMDEKMSEQQNKIESLETKLAEVMTLIDPKDTAQLTKKVGGMDRQIAKLNKSIEKIASHVVEK